MGIASRYRTDLDNQEDCDGLFEVYESDILPTETVDRLARREVASGSVVGMADGNLHDQVMLMPPRRGAAYSAARRKLLR